MCDAQETSPHAYTYLPPPPTCCLCGASDHTRSHCPWQKHRANALWRLVAAVVVADTALAAALYYWGWPLLRSALQ